MILAFTESFHGRPMGALALTASSELYRRRLAGLFTGVYHTPYPYYYRCSLKHESPETCGLACLNLVEEENLMAHAVEVGNYIQSRFRKAQKGLPIIGDVRGKGLMVGVELINADGSPAGEIIKAVIQEVGASGIALTKCGASSLRFAPPLIITQEQAGQGVDIIIEVLRCHQ